ncbi:transglycosylase family protein [Patulibacter minatonensis]|uniref:transglycosylase family protein n=1 Tax=Patulibacter minatonensis TaxID=298163 RepID=UPI00047BE2BA|nr:transglycosylase family protein [Patulibacter minatonensis]
MFVPSALRGRTGVIAGGLLIALLLFAVVPRVAPGAQSSSQLQGTIDAQKGRERSLRSTAQRLGALEASASKAVAAAQNRLAQVQQEYDVAQGKLATTSSNLRATRAKLVQLRRKLEQGRDQLAAVLRSHYTADRPGLVDVVVSSKGFAEVLERINFLKRVQASDTKIVDLVRDSRDAAKTDEGRYAKLRVEQAKEAQEATSRRNAMASMTAGLEQRRASLAQARAAKVAALSSARSKRKGAEKTLAKLEAAQAKAARQYTAPSSSPRAAGGSQGAGSNWAIPWAIVQCESGGQNFTPNSLGASGYYQFMPQTWKALGGSTPNAYQASKAEQDRLAAKLWNGGAGARNWDCAAIVGITG